MIEQKPVISVLFKSCCKNFPESTLTAHFGSHKWMQSKWVVAVGQCSVYSLSSELAFKYHLCRLDVRWGSFSGGIMKLFFRCLWSREAQKCLTGKVVMRVGVWSQLGKGELVECQGKWVWVDHKQLSGKQGACIWQYKEGKRRRKKNGMQKSVEVIIAVVFWTGMSRAKCIVKARERVLQ